jgi:hypothetical protein
MFHAHKYIEEAQRGRAPYTEATRDRRPGMMMPKRAPALRRDALMPPEVWAREQILAYRPWRDLPSSLSSSSLAMHASFVSDHGGSNSQAIDFESVEIYLIFTAKNENIMENQILNKIYGQNLRN